MFCQCRNSRREEMVNVDFGGEIVAVQQIADANNVRPSRGNGCGVTKFAPPRQPAVREIKRIPTTATSVAVEFTVLEQVKQLGAKFDVQYWGGRFQFG